jgi:hypothetical protein
MNSLWLGLLEPFILSKPIGHDKLPMFFWGPLNGPGAAKKKEGCFATRQIASLRYATANFNFFLNGLDPDGCLVADLRKVQTITFEKVGRRDSKGSSSGLNTDPAKKMASFFAMEMCFLLTGAF